MAFGDWFLGKKGEIEKTTTLSPEQEKLMQQLYGFAEPRIGEGLPAWGGEWTAPPTEGEEWGLGRYKEAVKGMDPGEVSDWYMKYIAPGEQKYMAETIIPGIKESMVPGGTLRGTGTERAIGEAWSQYGMGQLGRIGETIMGERAAGREMLPGYMTAAALPRMIEQEELNKEFAEFVRTTPELSPILNLVMQIMGVGTQAAFYQPSTTGFLSEVLGAGAKVAGAYYGSKGGGEED